MAWRVHPEVAGELGEETQMNAAVHPPELFSLHLRFEGWLGDDIIEVFPCFVVTLRLAEAIERSTLTGWSLDVAKVTVSAEFEEMYPGRKLPEFRWLRVDKRPGRDFSVSSDHCLVVSDAALALLHEFALNHAEVEPA